LNPAGEVSMRAFVMVLVWLVVALAPSFAHAQDAEALRREIEQLRRQQEQYQKSIESLSQRLQRLESQPPPTSAQPSAPAPPRAPTGASRPARKRPEPRRA